MQGHRGLGWGAGARAPCAIADLEEWIAARRAEALRQGRPPEQAHITRMVPSVTAGSRTRRQRPTPSASVNGRIASTGWRQAMRPRSQAAMSLHLLKLCVGCESIADLEEWIAARRAEAASTGWRQAMRPRITQ
jgi:hypothetical protein